MDSNGGWGHSGVTLGDALSNGPDMTEDSMDFALDNAFQDSLATDTLVNLFQDIPRLYEDETNMMNETPEQVLWETPEKPCDHCVLGSYSCKRLKEGSGCCTSCIALGLTCSFDRRIHDALDTYNGFTENAWSGANLGQANVLSLEELNEPLPPSSSDLLGNLPSRPAGFTENIAIATARPATPPPKIGARFSRECVRILKDWLLTHNRHPYPSDEEKEMLSRQTGLNRTQITNWLANARRRGKTQPPRPTSPHVRNLSASIDIPQRLGLPVMEAMSPLQRWEHSPPEHEAASVSAIARAVTASGSSATSLPLSSTFSFNYTDDSTNISLYNQSSASSAGTSKSSGSLASAFSFGTQNSWGSFGSAHFSNRGRRRRHRRTSMKKEAPSASSLAGPPKTFQCTFCTETFRTKYDWQRHEKSLHLSLERWVCAPEGPRAINPDNGRLCCSFCGEENPSDAHIDTHNHSMCQGRPGEERTFYRKDHLNQHLRLVHNAKFLEWSMKDWKATIPEIRSRCGFCGITLDTWTTRVGHLAEHFKTGYSMADWKGDWGFDASVLDMIENSMPPYLIHHQRLASNPDSSCNAPPASPRNAYELIKQELAYFSTNHWNQYGRAPTDMDLLLEGCRIIFASELLSLQGIATQPSWLRDLIMSKSVIAQKARFGPLRAAAENRLQILKINGKDNLFEECPMETQLRLFVKSKQLLGLTTMDDELQEEACRIVGRVEEVCNFPSDVVANWLLRMIRSSTEWLPEFRKRAHLPRSEDMQQSSIRSTDPTNIDSTIHNYSRLESELSDFLQQQHLLGREPTDEDLQREARMIIYEFDDGWNQTVADNLDWLAAFRNRNRPARDVGVDEHGGIGLAPSLPHSGRYLEAEHSSRHRTTSLADATVFCSPELEQGLEEYIDDFVAHNESLPGNGQNLHSETTAAENPILLGIFQEVNQRMRDGVSMTLADENAETGVELPSPMPADLSPHISDEDLSKIVASMDIELFSRDTGAETVLTTRPGDPESTLFYDTHL